MAEAWEWLKGVAASENALLLAVVTGIIAIVGGFLFELRKKQSENVTRLSESYSTLKPLEVEWLSKSSEYVSLLARLPIVGNAEVDISAIRVSAQALARAVSQSYAPNRGVSAVRREYRDALTDASGAANRYDGSVDSQTALASALQHASNVGGVYREVVQAYQTSLLISYRDALIRRKAVQHN